MIRTVFALIFAGLILSSCDANNAQVEFSIEAGGVPSGIFRTDDGFTALMGENDPDDWRTSPLYATSGFVVTNRAYPNPASLSGSDGFTIVISTIDAIPGGLFLVAFDGFGERYELGPIESIPGPGSYAISRLTSLIQGAQAGELWRLVLFDSRGEPVTYGDILIER